MPARRPHTQNGRKIELFLRPAICLCTGVAMVAGQRHALINCVLDRMWSDESRRAKPNAENSRNRNYARDLLNSIHCAICNRFVRCQFKPCSLSSSRAICRDSDCRLLCEQMIVGMSKKKHQLQCYMICL